MADINQTAAWVTARLTELGNATNEGLNTLVTDANIGNYSAGNVSGVVSVANGGTGANNAVDGLENLGGIAASDVSTVGKTGDYDDLLNKPTIPTISQTYNASSPDGMSGAAVAQGIAAETSRATTAEGNLNTAINTEKTRAQNAESTLNTAITTETNRAQGVEATLTTNIGHLTDNFADAYSTSSTYYKGDYVIHDNILYVANQNISTAEAWNAAHWDAVSVSDITIEMAEENAKSFPTGSASGAVASFADGADGIPIKDMTVNIEPVQAGTGDPSPSNVRAISGWDSSTVVNSAANLFSPKAFLKFAKRYLPSGTVDDVNNTFYYAANAQLYGTYGGFYSMPYKPNTQYTFIFTYMRTGGSETALGSNIRINYSDGTYTFMPEVSAKNTKETHVFVSTAGKTVVSVGKGNNSGQTTIYADECCILEGVHTADDFVPFEGSMADTPFGQTVYGGTLNPLTGVLTVDREMLTMDGTWTSDVGVYNPTLTGTNNIRCSLATRYRKAILPVCDSFKGMPPGTALAANQVATGSAEGTSYIYFKLEDESKTVEEWTTELAENPVHIVVGLATPLTVQLSTTQITTLLGQNNIWADSGDISVTYRADPTLYIDGQVAPIKAMVASEETGTTASKAYTAGQYFILDGAFCKALVNIASGATFTLGTNYSVTTIGAELYSALHS